MVEATKALGVGVGVLGIVSSIVFFVLRSFWLVTLLQVLALLAFLLLLAWALSGPTQAKVAHYFYAEERDSDDEDSCVTATRRALACATAVIAFGIAVLITLLLVSTKVTRQASWIPALPAVVTAFYLIVALPMFLVTAVAI
ncbi:hypothetical protein ATCC90586_001817 [Pythium insidiosum]|nr:hypothetical protein ATCC90586_001817 [Pythium insidiosum]